MSIVENLFQLLNEIVLLKQSWSPISYSFFLCLWELYFAQVLGISSVNCDLLFMVFTLLVFILLLDYVHVVFIVIDHWEELVAASLRCWLFLDKLNRISFNFFFCYFFYYPVQVFVTCAYEFESLFLLALINFRSFLNFLQFFLMFFVIKFMLKFFQIFNESVISFYWIF